MSDREHMAHALREAQEAEGTTSPNPPVGAVIVKDGRVLAAGHTAPAGGPHAEIVALRAAGAPVAGATLYTTLEPCSHHGRTGPCSDAIIAAGISRVVVGSVDRNPLVAGEGIARLEAAGVSVEVGVLGDACEAHNRPFFTWVTHKRPYVILKAAVGLDGRLATPSGDSKWISNAASRRRVHAWRRRADAILVGAGTVRTDDPLLTDRLEEGRPANPIRVILDGRLATPPSAQVYRTTDEAPTWLAVAQGTEEAALAPWRAAGVEILALPASDQGRIALPALLEALAHRGVVSLLVEGGAEVHGAFLAEGLVDEVRLFVAPRLLGAGPAWLSLPEGAVPGTVAEGWCLREMSVEQVEGDLLVRGRPERCGEPPAVPA